MGDTQGAKPVAISGSPNTTGEVCIDVMQEHLSKPLLGALLQLQVTMTDYDDSSSDILVIGQVSELQTQNRWHENASLKNYIKRRGELPNLTRVGDITTGKLAIIGTYDRVDGSYQKSRMSIPPGSGLQLQLVKRETIEAVMKSEESGVGYIGYFYGPGDLPAPVILRHFGHFDDGGTGEAYMGGVFGPSGNGKTVVAMTIDALWARNPQMGILFLDPQGEFSTDKIGGDTGFQFSLHGMLKTATGGVFDPANDVIHISDIRLEGEELFSALIDHSGLFDLIGIGTSKQKDACATLSQHLEKMVKGGFHLGKSLAVLRSSQPGDYESARDAIVQACADSYASGNRPKKLKEFAQEWTKFEGELITKWDSVSSRFAERDGEGNERPELISVVRDVMENGKKKILDLSPGELGIDDRYKLHLMYFAMKRIKQAASIAFNTRSKSGGGAKKSTSINCMIVLDEAGRFVSEHSRDDEKKDMSDYITAAVKEMRKYGVGWQFITQTVSEIQKDLYRMLHYRVYGVGLAVGAEEQHIRDREGKPAFEMYSTLPDPRLSRTFSFMVCGNLIGIGTTGNPMFIEGFKSDSEAMRENGLSAEFEAMKIALTLAPEAKSKVKDDSPFQIGR